MSVVPNNLTLQDKIYLAEQEIIKHYELNEGKCFISFSGGKDSTVLRHIALRLYPDLKVVFSNTTNELAEVLQYVKTFPDVITVTPKISFTQVLKKYGFPLVSKEVAQYVYELKHTHGKATRLKRFGGDDKGNGKLSDKWRFLAEQEFDVTHKCCAHLKKYPLERWAKKHGLKPMIALMSEESRLRQQLALYGKDDGKKIYPFLRTGWTDEDIWAYAKMHGIRFAECYYDRIVDGVFIPARNQTGCEFCGFGITLEENDRFERSKQLAPKRYDKIMGIMNNGVTFREAITIAKQKDRTPKLDLYGVKLVNSQFIDKAGARFIFNEVHSTTVTKQCNHCGSKKLKKAFGHYGNFPDSPDPITKKPRRVFVNSTSGYDCEECGMPVIDDLHQFNTELGVTTRLIEYIRENLDKKSFAEVTAEAGISYELVYDIVIYILHPPKKCPAKPMRMKKEVSLLDFM